MHLPNAGGWHARILPVLPMKPGDYALGSPQSRAAARSLLETRKTDELRFQAVSILDGSRLNLDGLAEAIRAGRIRAHAGESPLPFQPIERKRNGDAVGLHERIMQARARVERMRES